MIGVYFSGTGNTKYCLKQFLSLIEKNIPVLSIEEQHLMEELPKHQEIILAYPIYYSNLPKIVRDFLVEQKDVFRGKKIYIIATMGLFSGDGTGCSARLLKKYGAEVIGGLHLKMPDCIADVKALKRSSAKNKQLVAQANLKIEQAAYKFKRATPTQDGLSVFCHLAGLLGQRLWFYHKTKHYTDHLNIAPAKCTGCGLCIALCPMQNLHLVNQKAIAKGACTMCYRCINNCSQQAITLLGKTVIQQGKIQDYL